MNFIMFFYINFKYNDIMKNSKLKLRKFRIAKLNNARSILGGTETTTNDGTQDTVRNPPKCVKTSDEYEKE